MANPTLLTMPLCVNADKNTIPPTDAGTSGLFSEELGFQDINSLPLASGGKAPNRRDFNGVFALLGGIAYACQRGYTFKWDATQNYEVGCVVIDSTDGKRYECISDVLANATPPSSDPTHWKEFGADMTTLANTDLSNLTATGEAKFTGRADTSLNNLTQAGKDSFLERDFTIIYPNGGTEANPANVTINSRYVEDNPYSGYMVHCDTQILIQDEWGSINTMTSADGNSSYGAVANQYGDKIILQTGIVYITVHSNFSGNPFGLNTPSLGDFQTAPCRILVWKIGKIPT